MDRDQAIKLMQDLLRRVTEKKASDLFITAGFPPAIKIDGEIRPQSERALTAEQSATLVRAIMNDRQTKEFDATKECNFAIAPPGIGRFRVSAFVQQAAIGCVIRLINAKIPTFEELELPPILKEVVLSKRGLVIIVGGSGSGQSTPLVAVADHGSEGGGLAPAGTPDDDHQAALGQHHLLEDRRQLEFLEGRNLGVDQADDAADRRLLHEGADAETADAGGRDGEITLLAGVEVLGLAVVHDGAHQRRRLLGGERTLGLRANLTIDLDRRRKARGDE